MATLASAIISQGCSATEFEHLVGLGPVVSQRVKQLSQRDPIEVQKTRKLSLAEQVFLPGLCRHLVESH